jgi:hypothetical protein
MCQEINELSRDNAEAKKFPLFPISGKNENGTAAKEASRRWSYGRQAAKKSKEDRECIRLRKSYGATGFQSIRSKTERK